MKKQIEIYRRQYGTTEFQHRKKLRDYFLARALGFVTGEGGWTRCSKLAAEIRRFESRVWSRVRFKVKPPDRCSELDALLFNAFKLEIKVPDTTQGLVNATQIYPARNLGEADVE